MKANCVSGKGVGEERVDVAGAKTKPIWPAERAAIADWGFRIGDSKKRAGSPEARNVKQSQSAGREPGAVVRNKANLPGSEVARMVAAAHAGKARYGHMTGDAPVSLRGFSAVAQSLRHLIVVSSRPPCDSIDYLRIASSVLPKPARTDMPARGSENSKREKPPHRPPEPPP